MIDRDMPGVLVPIPLSGERVFRNQAMDDILTLLYRNPHDTFGVRELRDVTGHGAQTVDTALTLLGELDIIETRPKGNQKLVSINRERIQKPYDPLMEIPQEEFRSPVKTFLDRAREEWGALSGVIVFGSVARGEADRASDIDVFVLVGEGLMEARRVVQDVEKQLSDRAFGGDRYEFQVMVESVESAEQYGEKLQTIFSEGIVVYESDQLDAVREVVLHGG